MRAYHLLSSALGAALLAFGAPASAGVVVANPSSFNGAEVLFNAPAAITTGPKLLGFTNDAAHVGYYFEGTTISGPGGVIGTNLAGLGGGQAYVAANGFTSQSGYPGLTSLTYYRQDGGTFDNTEFKLEAMSNFVGNTSLQVHLYAWDQNNIQYDLGLLTFGGANRFGLRGSNGDTISRVQYFVTGGVVGRHKQTRLDSLAVNPAVPEPVTWAMMMVGFGALGASLRRRKADGARLRFSMGNPA